MAPERISPHPHGHRTLAAIVITDGVSFSARMSTDEELTLGLIHRDLQMMQGICEDFEGQVLKSTGDGLLMYFVSASQAVGSAIAIQQQLVELSAHRSPEDVLMHRIGVHLGDVFLSETDVMGNGVNIAARLQTQAQPGGICLSQTVYDVVKSQLSLPARYMGALQLKNIQDPVPAYHLSPWNSAPTAIASDAVQQGSHPDLRRAPEPLSGDRHFPDSDPTPQQLDSGGFSVTRMDGDWASSPPIARSAGDRPPSQPAPLSAGHNEISLGELIHDRYSIQQMLGQGGFGRTYLAKDTHRFEDLCVLKEFMPLNTSDYVVEKARILFEREAKALYQLNHPQIPKFLAWFTYGHRLFIVQEYVCGLSYSRLLQMRLQQGRPFTENEVLQWLYDLLMVLDYLHNQGIVHRDISTDNVMQPDQSPKPVLIDFGLVKQTVSDVLAQSSDDSSNDSSNEAPSSNTSSKRSFVGKIGYAPPEQIRMGQCFPSSDLYALAVTALVLLTGKQPNQLIDPNSLNWCWRSHVQVDPEFARWIERMLTEKPQDRYPTASAALCAIHDSPLIQQVNLRPVETQIQSQAAAASVNLSLPQEPPSPVNRVNAAAPASLEPTELNAEFLEACRRSLVQCVGPMANYLLADLQGSHPHLSREQFILLLVQDIPDPQQAETFRQAMQAYLQQHAAAVAASPEAGGMLSAELLERCQRELAQCIGPMASFILDDVMVSVQPTTAQDLIRAIALEIPDPKKAKEFEAAMRLE